MSNPVTPGQPGGQGPYGPQGQFGPAGPQGQAGPQEQFGPPQDDPPQFDAQQLGPQQQFGPAGPQQPAGTPPAVAYPQVPRKRGRSRLIISIVALVVVAGLGVAAYLATRSSPLHAKVGDCLNGSAITSTAAQDAGDMKIVNCGSADAKFMVVGKVDNKTKTEFTASTSNPCTAFPTATTALWGQTSGDNGFILCLADK
ncbi:MAG TPA: hypothetical protein VJT31_03400 [Rugosimonospora sp.]|nr:hypothetical protein [Rugosimonospora sp.]